MNEQELTCMNEQELTWWKTDNREMVADNLQDLFKSDPPNAGDLPNAIKAAEAALLPGDTFAVAVLEILRERYDEQGGLQDQHEQSVGPRL